MNRQRFAGLGLTDDVPSCRGEKELRHYFQSVADMACQVSARTAVQLWAG
jgi:hypothetical protein